MESQLNLKRSGYELAALAIILCATLLRLLFDALGWPATNSDEGTMGIMAMHIAFRGEHPVLFYGQNYMGAMEAYLAAAFFRLFGTSLFTLRLSVILLDALFLVSTYLLTSLLYNKKLALITVALLSLGSNAIFMRELYATGGSTQTLLFGSLSFLLAAWLGLTYRQDLSESRRWLRYAAYGGWGLVVGMGVWSDSVVLPFFLLSMLLLLLFCWHDLRSLAPFCVLAGFILGVSPLLAYNIQAPPDQNSLSILFGLFRGTNVQSPHTLAQFWLGIKNTIQISLPTATGDPSCPIPSLDYANTDEAQSTSCMVLHTLWGLGYLLLLGYAIVLAVLPLWKLRSSSHTAEERETRVRSIARLCLLASAVVAIVAYAVSSAPLGAPQSHARYLVGLLMVTPALLWPLWLGIVEATLAVAHPHPTFGETRMRAGDGKRRLYSLAHLLVLVLIGGAFLLGTLGVVSDIPAAQAANRQQDALIRDLLQRGIRHIYTEYWTCDRIAFISREQIICGVVNNSLQPSHNRDTRYYTLVSADPHSAYVFPNVGTQFTAPQISTRTTTWKKFVLDGYVVYVPT
jgi:hypothetical protein